MLIVGKSQQSQMEADVTEPETITGTATTTISPFMELNVLFLNTANRDFDTRRLSDIQEWTYGRTLTRVLTIFASVLLNWSERHSKLKSTHKL